MARANGGHGACASARKTRLLPPFAAWFLLRMFTPSRHDDEKKGSRDDGAHEPNGRTIHCFSPLTGPLPQPQRASTAALLKVPFYSSIGKSPSEL